MSAPKTRRGRRVFIGPVEICGIAEGLAVGLQQLGMDTQVCLSRAHPFRYGGVEQKSWIHSMWSLIGEKRKYIVNNNYVKKLLLKIIHNFWSLIVFTHALMFFNAFIYISGQTITNLKLELLILKFFKKKIIIIYVGSDARPPYINGLYNLNFSSEEEIKNLNILISEKVKMQEKYADFVVNFPSTAHFQEKLYINWFSLGVPRVLPTLDVPLCAHSHDQIRVLHSPSSPLFKGTAIVLEAIERLKNKGYPIELIVIENMSNKAVLMEISRCDFVVDQVYSDTPLAVFAMEAAFYGKPAVVGGYGFEKLQSLVAESMWPPSKTCHPDNFEQAIEDLIINSEERERLGIAAQSFVRDKWDALVVARRYLHLIDGDVLDEWWVEPKNFLYIEGAGQSADQTRGQIRQMIDKYGLSSLQLSHRPELEQAFLEFAGEEISPR